jgi:outer membrane protein assembly factor BamD
MSFKKILILFIGVALVTSCSRYQKILKSTDNDAKFNAAVKYFEKKDYFRALPLFEELITVYRGQGKAEKVYYYYAYCNYYLEDYELAAYHFDNFVNTFPRSEYTEECAFLHAYCYYKSSPDYSLDQENTIKAIAKMQIFVNKYPNSTRVAECNALIDKLRYKLEEKMFELSKLYFNVGDYKAAVTSFKNLLTEYPATSFREEAMYYVTNSYYLYAQNSIETRKAERFLATVDAGNEFLNQFPQSKLAKDVKDIIESSKNQINKNKITDSRPIKP